MSFHQLDYIGAQQLATASKSVPVHWYVNSINGDGRQPPHQSQVEKFNLGNNIFGIGLYDSNFVRHELNKSIMTIQYQIVKEVDGKSNSATTHNAPIKYENNGAHVVIPIEHAGVYTITVGRSTFKGFVAEDIQKPDPAVTTTSRWNKDAGDGVPRA